MKDTAVYIRASSHANYHGSKSELAITHMHVSTLSESLNNTFHRTRSI
jgi:hypothetical protein